MKLDIQKLYKSRRMLKILFMLLLQFVCAYSIYAQKIHPNPVKYVNMMIGTCGQSPTEYGGTVPAVAAPFGMTQWCAATRINGISKTMYHYQDSSIIGFMATHQPAIWMGDYGFITILPQADSVVANAVDRKTQFSHSEEKATPYYYAVNYRDKKKLGFKTEITATERCSFFKVSYPLNHTPILFFEAGRGEGENNYVQIIKEKRQIIIYNAERQDRDLGPPLPGFKCYYVLQFNNDFDQYGVTEGVTKFNNRLSITGKKIGGFVSFKKGSGKPVLIKIGSSFINSEQAENNLSKEIKNWDFDRTVQQNRAIWNKMLSRISIQGNSENEKTIFYTALFHTLQFPRLFSEYGKYYSPFDDKIHRGVSYNAYSLWDTFRAEHPLLCLTAPERVNDMVQSLVNMYNESGWLPKWPNPTFTNIMIATHADAVISDAYVKGFKKFDISKAYEAVHKDAYVPPDKDTLKRWADRDKWTSYEARAGLTYYLKLGYVPSDKTNESVSNTLEFALDDYCIAQMAKGMGKTHDYAELMKRSKNYINLFNSETGMMAPRLLNGKWADPETGFTEGGKWTYLFCVMQDVPGLIKRLGGKQQFVNKLDENFTKGYYRHDNEPGHHVAYLYDYAGRYDKTQQRIEKIMIDNYKDQPDGLKGNDDCGQMSAWYIFSSLGFYPVTPASGIYALGKPRFKRSEILLNCPGASAHSKLVIVAKNLSPKNCYVQRVTFNNTCLKTPFITHNQLVKGGILEFTMGDIPRKTL